MNVYYPHHSEKPILALLEYHGGQGCPIYAVGSSWLANRSVDNETIHYAIRELHTCEDEENNLTELCVLLDMIRMFNQDLQSAVKDWAAFNGINVSELSILDENFVYLVYQTLCESGRSVFDGDLDHILDDKQLNSLMSVLQAKLEGYSDFAGGGQLDQAFEPWEREE